MSTELCLGHLIRAVEEHNVSTRGMALHYLTLHSILLGMEAQSTLEFGAGASTSIFLAAHQVTGGRHFSISTEPRDAVDGGRCARMSVGDRWFHFQGLSSEILPNLLLRRLGVVLHDGSHSTPVVESDLRAVLPFVAQYGLILVHDTQHSYVGPSMRQAIENIVGEFDVSHVTLPYGFGLTIIRNESSLQPPMTFTWKKHGSDHRTASCRIGP